DMYVLSFAWQPLKQMHDELPAVSLVVNEKWSGVRAAFRAKRLGTRYIDLHYSAFWGGYIRLVTRNNFKLLTYPLNDHKKANRWAKAGLHAVITDYPDRFQ